MTAKQNTQIINRLRNDRTIQALLLAMIMVFVMGMLRPDKPQGISLARFWMLKIQARGCADMALAGDSRVFCSLSPERMNEVIPDCRIFNFAFSGNGYSAAYCQRLEDVLDPQSRLPTLVLGITPSSLRTDATQRNGFLDHLALSPRDRWIRYHFGWIYDFIEPMSFRDAWQGLFPATKKYHDYRDYHANGWVAADTTPISHKDELRRYRERFRECDVSEEVIAALLEQVRQWTNKGIRVFGFRPPTSEEMFELEESLSGFHEDEFTKRFEAAGGVWIAVRPTGYESHDGSHLRYTAAETFSRDFALLLRRHMTDPSQ